MLGLALNLRATHENTLVMRSSLSGDEDQGAEVPTVRHERRRHARCLPDPGGEFLGGWTGVTLLLMTSMLTADGQARRYVRRP